MPVTYIYLPGRARLGFFFFSINHEYFLLTFQRHFGTMAWYERRWTSFCAVSNNFSVLFPPVEGGGGVYLKCCVRSKLFAEGFLDIGRSRFMVSPLSTLAFKLCAAGDTGLKTG